MQFPQTNSTHVRNAFNILALAACISTGSAFSVAPPSFTELVDESGNIVRGEVVSVESFWTTSRNGTPIIKTRVTWTIARSLKGAEEETLTLEFLGGQVGTESMSVSGMPEFKVGDDDYLFLEPDRRVICPLIAAGHGRYSICKDQASGTLAVHRENGRPLSSTSQVAASLLQPESVAVPTAGLTPEAFEKEITSTLNRLENQSGNR